MGDRWIQLGSEISGGNAFRRAGDSVSLSGDGSRGVVLSSRLAGYSNAAGSFAGCIKVFELQANRWTNLGAGIDSVGGNAQGIDLSANGSRVVFGPLSQGFGLLRVLDWDGSTWAQLGTDALALDRVNGFGQSVRRMAAEGRDFWAPRTARLQSEDYAGQRRSSGGV